MNMKKIEITRSEHQLTPEDIKKLELEYHINLPDDYKNFLLMHNGGQSIKDCCPLIEYIGDNEQTGTDTDINYFAGIHNNYYHRLIPHYHAMQGRIPQELLPIAENSGGDEICLCIDGSNYGKVYFWAHEGEALAFGYKEPWYDNIYLVANSFKEFINSLYSTELINYNPKTGEGTFIDIHDKYSLPYCTELKKYGKIFLEFFDDAPRHVDEFKIEKPEKTDNIYLKYEDRKTNKRYVRHMKKSGEVVRDFTENIG